MTKPVAFGFGTLFIGLFLGILSPLFAELIKPEKPLPVLGNAPAFELSDSSGAVFSSQQLAKKVWVVNFFFTSCGGPCPIQSSHMSQLANKLKDRAGVNFVSISVDPDKDTSEALAEYAKRFHADTNRWHFLRGENEKVKSLLNKGFKLGSVDEPRFHSTRFVLVDGQGKIRGYYEGTEKHSVSELLRDIPKLKPKA